MCIAVERQGPRLCETGEIDQSSWYVWTGPQGPEEQWNLIQETEVDNKVVWLEPTADCEIWCWFHVTPDGTNRARNGSFRTQSC